MDDFNHDVADQTTPTATATAPSASTAGVPAAVPAAVDVGVSPQQSPMHYFDVSGGKTLSIQKVAAAFEFSSSPSTPI